MAMNAHVTIEELLGAVFSVRAVSYQMINMQLKESDGLVLRKTSCFFSCR
jgi:hypothetical protein